MSIVIKVEYKKIVCLLKWGFKLFLFLFKKEKKAKMDNQSKG